MSFYLQMIQTVLKQTIIDTNIITPNRVFNDDSHQSDRYLSFLTCFQGYAQVIYGVNNYTQYHIGRLPIIISASHGGFVAPASIPDRTCNNPTTVTDSNILGQILIEQPIMLSGQGFTMQPRA